MILSVPEFDPEATWPTLGRQVCDWIEANLVFGPGDIHGLPAVVDEQTRGLIYSAYEVYPQGSVLECRRRFRRVAISLGKGLAKTELAAWIAACELHPDAPVRCDGFDARGEPVGVGVIDPYIPMAAVTEDQTEDLAYGALRSILLESILADDFDIGLERIIRKDGRGKAEAVASSPNPRDGARTSHNQFDETHRFVLARLKRAHRTMLANAPKRKAADAWSLETTTAPTPGEGSVAEETWGYADLVAQGKKKDASLFFFHRQAGDEHDLSTREGVRAAVVDARGSAASWSNIDAIVDQFYDPQADRAYLERVWLNRRVQSSLQVFNTVFLGELVSPLPGRLPARKTPISIGFDGSRTMDATGIVGTVIETGYQFVIGIWERPENADPEWEVPFREVDEAMSDAFDRWRPIIVYCDPPYWESAVDEWHGRWPDRVVRFHTHQHKKMAVTLAGYVAAVKAAEVAFDGHPDLLRHMGNARKHELNITDDNGEKLYVMVKERRNGPMKIDLAMAATLSWAARGKAIADGALKRGGSRPGRTTVKLY